MERGGPFMWLLALLSLFGFILFIERTLFLHRGQIRTEQFLDGIKNLLAKGRRMEALTLCEDMPGPVPGLVKAILLKANDSVASMRAAAESAALVEIPILERRVGAMAAIARVAPLIGLAGTLLGIIEAFNIIGVSAAAYPEFGLLLKGLGNALLTTLVGILIAVMGHFAHHFLHGRVRALVHDLEYTAHELILFIETVGGAATAKEADDAGQQ